MRQTTAVAFMATVLVLGMATTALCGSGNLVLLDQSGQQVVVPGEHFQQSAPPMAQTQVAPGQQYVPMDEYMRLLQILQYYQQQQQAPTSTVDPIYVDVKPTGYEAWPDGTVKETIPSYKFERPCENLGRCVNLARQTAERINGGLGCYRADRLMHGRYHDLVSQGRLWVEPDGSVIIKAYGRPVFGQGDGARLGEVLDIYTMVKIGPQRDQISVLQNCNPHVGTPAPVVPQHQMQYQMPNQMPNQMQSQTLLR